MVFWALWDSVFDGRDGGISMTSQGYPQEDLLDLLNSLDESLPTKNGVEATKLEIVPGKFVPPAGVAPKWLKGFGKKTMEDIGLRLYQRQKAKKQKNHAQKRHQTCQKCIA